MVRFSATESEIAALVRFLSRRSEGGVWMLPLEASHRDELRYRRTPRTFLRRLMFGDQPLYWGLLPIAGEPDSSGNRQSGRIPVRRAKPVVSPASSQTGTDAVSLQVDPDLNGLILLSLGPPSGPERRRDGILATRDPLHSTPSGTATSGDSTPEAGAESDAGIIAEMAAAKAASDLRSELVEKCARRLRRKGERQGSRWILPA